MRRRRPLSLGAASEMMDASHEVFAWVTWSDLVLLSGAGVCLSLLCCLWGGRPFTERFSSDGHLDRPTPTPRQTDRQTETDKTGCV
mmetsp:Transcript_47927/g.119920  ORF Transcript_47927/g.119920 Transcript_47927/m.119920 type:complete len:86 (-) Transcript_47927:285-542(-)